MKPFALAISLLLSAGDFQISPPELPPAEALSQALLKIRPCDSSVEAHVLDDNHQLVRSVEIDNKGKEKPKITLPMLFRTGRFQYADVGDWIVENREVRVISFYPAPSKSQPKALPGEDTDYHKAMNYLVGWIFLDRETGDLARVDARLSKELNYRLGLVSIKEATLSFEQVFEDGAWEPAYFRLDGDGHGPRGIKRKHELRTYRFACE